MNKDSLGDRMKAIENVERKYLYSRVPIIIRLDIKAGHTLTRKYFKNKPHDEDFLALMKDTTLFLCENIQNIKFGYCQSDEISLMMCNDKTFDTQGWFDNNLQKIVSISAAMASAYFTKRAALDEIVCFDCRVFNLAKEEVVNYFIWRSQDCERNSIQGYAQSMFSHKQLHGLNNNELQEKMMTEKQFNWSKIHSGLKNGFMSIKRPDGQWVPVGCPKLTSDDGRLFIEKYLKPSIFVKGDI